MRAIWAENRGYLAVIRRGSKAVRMPELRAFWRLVGERIPSRIMTSAGEKSHVNERLADADGVRPREGVSESFSGSLISNCAVCLSARHYYYSSLELSK
jgi:hypothetical protein